MSLKTLRTALAGTLQDILRFWQTKMPDTVYGGFLGGLQYNGEPVPQAAKGAVLNARVLWTFSTAALHLKSESCRQTAEYAYQWFSGHFFDPVSGGVFWSTDYKGGPLETKKQVYAQAFAIYALSAYYRLTGNRDALQQAIGLFHTLEQHSFDPVYGGYFEAFSREWEALEDLRLSDKDANEKKTMNTHLHVLEGYAYLYKVWPDELLGQKIAGLLDIFSNRIIDKDTATQGLFFDEQWVRKDTLISFGHDIEASWLLQEAAEVLGDAQRIISYRSLAVKMAEASLRGIDSDGGMWHEYDTAGHHLVKEKHWWPQAEALVGYLNAWQLSGNPVFLKQLHSTWPFIRHYLLHQSSGEWVWGVYEDYRPMAHEGLAGFWKCPYHNARACMEIIERIPPGMH